MTSILGRYFFLGLGLTFTGSAAAIASYFVVHVIPFAALGIAIVILGLTSVSLPDQVNASNAMKALLQGSTLGIDPLLDDVSARKNAPSNLQTKVAPVQTSDWKHSLSDAEETIAEEKEEGTKGIRAVYLPPDQGKNGNATDIYEGKASVYIPLYDQAIPVTLEEMRAAPLHLLENGTHQRGIRIFTPGAYLGQVQELKGEDTSIEEALKFVLVDFSELCSLVRASEIEDTVVVEINDVKVAPESKNYRDILGSLPTSLAASVVSIMVDAPVLITDEEIAPTRTVARLSILRLRKP